MSVVDVKATWRDCESHSGVFADQSTLKYSVLLSDITSAAAAQMEAENAPGLPAYGTAHPHKPFMWVVARTAIPRGPLLWDVYVFYSNEALGNRAEDPLQEDPRVAFRHVETEEMIDQDIHGNAIVTSAGEPVDPPPTRRFSDLALLVSRNEETFDPLLASSYVNMQAVNANTFLGMAPGQAKMVDWSAERMRVTSRTYWQVNYEIHFRTDAVAWKRRFLDQGFRELTGTDDDGKPTFALIKDDDNNPVNQPVLLDGSGSKLKDGLDAVWLIFEDKPPMDFSVLNLDTILDE